MVTESVVVLTLLGYDALFFLNLFDYHVLNGDAPGHDVLYRPVRLGFSLDLPSLVFGFTLH